MVRAMESPSLKFLASSGGLVIRSEGEMWETLRKSKCEVRQLGIRDQYSAQETRYLGRTESPLPSVEMY